MRRASFTKTRQERLSGKPNLVPGQPWRLRSWSAARSIKRNGWVSAQQTKPARCVVAPLDCPQAPRGPGTETAERDGRTECADSRPTMIFLDWDDTLLPTTHLRTAGLLDSAGNFVSMPESALEEELNRLQDEVVRLLSATAASARVVVVTSASEGWVQSSARKYFPRAYAMLARHRITVRHARTQEGNGCNPARWKADAMWEELASLRWSEHDTPQTEPGSPWAAMSRQDQQQHQQQCCDEPQSMSEDADESDARIDLAENATRAARLVRIISIGDSQFERTAAGVVARNGDVVVTVKLKSAPSCSALRKQLARVRQAVPSLVTANASAEVNAVATDRRPSTPCVGNTALSSAHPNTTGRMIHA